MVVPYPEEPDEWADAVHIEPNESFRPGCDIKSGDIDVSDVAVAAAGSDDVVWVGGGATEVD